MKVTKEVFPTPTGGAASQIPLETASPQPEASAAAPDTERETDIRAHHLQSRRKELRLRPSSGQLPRTALRCRALLKLIWSSSSSRRRRTSSGLKSRPRTGWAEPHSHRKSRAARKARSCWARWSSAIRLLAPDGEGERVIHFSTTWKYV